MQRGDDVPERTIEPEPQPLRGRKPVREKAEKVAVAVDKTPRKAILPWFENARLMSAQEAERLHDPLKAALRDLFKYSDEGIAWYCGVDPETMPPIWSNLDNDEYESLAHVLLSQAQRSPEAAEFVRGVVNSDDYIVAGIIVVPRAIQTTQMLAQAHRLKRQKAQILNLSRQRGPREAHRLNEMER